MRLNAEEQPELAAQVQAVLLDGKPVPMCYAADEEEGWVISYVPQLPNSLGSVDPSGKASNPSGPADMKKVKRTGQVEIVFNESASVGN